MNKKIELIKKYKLKNKKYMENFQQKNFVNLIEEFKKKKGVKIKIKINKKFNPYIQTIINSIKQDSKNYKKIPKIIRKKLFLLEKKSRNKNYILLYYSDIKGFKFFFTQIYKNFAINHKKFIKETKKMFWIKKKIIFFLHKNKIYNILYSIKKIKIFFNNL